MKIGDSSDEETPPSNPNRKALVRKEQSKAVSMLVAMKTKDRVRRDAIIFVTITKNDAKHTLKAPC